MNGMPPPPTSFGCPMAHMPSALACLRRSPMSGPPGSPSSHQVSSCVSTGMIRSSTNCRNRSRTGRTSSGTGRSIEDYLATRVTHHGELDFGLQSDIADLHGVLATLRSEAPVVEVGTGPAHAYIVL